MPIERIAESDPSLCGMVSYTIRGAGRYFQAAVAGVMEGALGKEMVVALGHFVTEVGGSVENVMFGTILAVAEENANEVHRQLFEKPLPLRSRC